FTASSCTDSSGNALSEPRIPVFALLTVTGCNDSTFNVTGAPVLDADFPAATESIYESGATATATGCTISGLNDDSVENVTITAVSGSTLTAIFAHTHASSDLWGEVAVTEVPGTTNHHEIKNIAVSGAPGFQFFAGNVAMLHLDSDGFSAGQFLTSGAVELSD